MELSDKGKRITYYRLTPSGRKLKTLKNPKRKAKMKATKKKTKKSTRTSGPYLQRYLIGYQFGGVPLEKGSDIEGWIVKKINHPIGQECPIAIVFQKQNKKLHIIREPDIKPFKWKTSIYEKKNLIIEKIIPGTMGIGRAIKYSINWANQQPNFKRKTKKKATKKTPRRASSAKHNPKRKTAATSLIKACRTSWDRYCERPNKTRLKAVFECLEVMKGSRAKTVRGERGRCLRTAKAEAKRLGLSAP